MKIDRKFFFDGVRQKLFAGRLTQTHVDNMNEIIDKFEELNLKDPRWLAYILATVYHETGEQMRPLREGFSPDDKSARAKTARYAYGQPDGETGHVYYGRGQVQLTWKENYARMGKLIGVDLVNNPDLALDPDYSVDILFEGMTKGASKRGDFTGKSLEHYFNETTDSPILARKIINGSDRAGLITMHHHNFLKAIREVQNEN